MMQEQTMIEQDVQPMPEGEEQPTVEIELEIASEEQDDAPDEVTVLRTRIGELEAQLAERERLSERIGRECDEFATYFPEVSLHTVPDEVWGDVHAGIPLSAAYALYEKKQQKQREAGERIGARGAAMTGGGVDAAGEQYFSPSQVRAMSPQEVRANYDRIFDSMRHWQ